MASNIEVSITANIADFQEKLLTAQQNLKQATAEMQRWSAEVQASGGANTYAVGRFKEASLATAEYTQEVAAARSGITAAIPKMTELAGSTSIATREILVLGREAARGNFSRMAGSLTILATQGFGVQTGMLAAAAGVAALVGGLVYLISRSEQAAIALDKIKLGASFEGGLSLTTQQVQGMIEQIDKLPGVSQSDAEKVVAAFSSMRTTSIPEIQGLGVLVKDYADLTQTSVDKAAEALKKSFSDPIKNVVAFTTSFRDATETQRQQALAAERGGNANAAAAVMVDALRTAMENQGKALDELAAKQTFGLLHLNTESEAELRVEARRRANTERIGEEAAAVEILTERRQAQNAVLDAALGKMAGLSAAPNTAMLTGVEDAAKLDPSIEKQNELNAKIKEFTALLPQATIEAQRLGNSAPLDQLTAGLTKAKEELSSLQLGPIVDKARASIAQLQSTWSGSETGMLTAERNIWAGVAHLTTNGTKEHLQAVEEMGRLEVQIRHQSATAITGLGKDAIAQARDDISAIEANDELSKQQQLTGARDVWAQLLAGSKLNAQQRIEAQRDYNLSVAALNRANAADEKEISADQLKTDLEIRKLVLEAQKADLDAQVASHQITADQKLAIERTLANELAQLDIDELQNEQAGLDKQSVEYQKLADQIRLIRAKLNVDLANFGKQAVAQSNKDDLEQALAWRDSLQEMGQASDTFVRDIFGGQKTLIQSLQGLTQQWVQSEIAADLKYFTTRMLYSALGLSEEVKNLRGGLLVTLLTEQQKTAAVTTGAAARTAADTTSSGSGIVALAGDAIKAIVISGGKTFAEVYAFFAGILGPGAAAPASASQAAVLAASGPLMAFDVGAWDIPHDMAAIVHQGETIMPTSFAQGFRANANSGDGGGGDTHIQVNYTSYGRLTQDEISANARHIAQIVAQQYNKNPGLRPDF